MSGTRVCVICGAGIEHRHPTALTCGYECWKARRQAASRRRYALDPTPAKERARLYVAENPEKVREWQRNYRDRNRQHLIERDRARRAKNLERERESDREYARRRSAAFKLIREIEAKGLEALL